MIGNDETDIPYSYSNDAALFGSNAVWVLYASAVRGDGGIWRDGLSLLSESEDGSGMGAGIVSFAVSALCQNCVGTVDLEHR